jgi:hypothetical protein
MKNSIQRFGPPLLAALAGVMALLPAMIWGIYQTTTTGKSLSLRPAVL